MSRQNEIKVFKPNSKRADFTIRSVTEQGGVKKVAEMLAEEDGDKVRSAFRSLKRLGAESLTFRSTTGRKIKVMVAEAA